MYQIILFWNDALHVSDGLSVHHQEFKTVQYIQQYLFDICLLLYSLELLVMDGKTVCNM